MSTTAICRMTFNLSRIRSAEKSSKDSAQSPAWSRKASPCGHLGQRRGQVAGLAGEDERGQAAQLRLHLLAGVLVRPGRLLVGRVVAPRPRVPGRDSVVTAGLWPSHKRTASARPGSHRGVPGARGPCRTTSAGRAPRLLGGTFDPPHVGHVAAAATCREPARPRPRPLRGGQRPLAEEPAPTVSAGRRPPGHGRGDRRRGPRRRGEPDRARPGRAQLHGRDRRGLCAAARHGGGPEPGAVPHRRGRRRTDPRTLAPGRDLAGLVTWGGDRPGAPTRPAVPGGRVDVVAGSSVDVSSSEVRERGGRGPHRRPGACGRRTLHPGPGSVRCGQMTVAGVRTARPARPGRAGRPGGSRGRWSWPGSTCAPTPGAPAPGRRGRRSCPAGHTVDGTCTWPGACAAATRLVGLGVLAATLGGPSPSWTCFIDVRRSPRWASERTDRRRPPGPEHAEEANEPSHRHKPSRSAEPRRSPTPHWSRPGAAEDKLGGDTVVLAMGELLGVVDAFVVTSGRNDRQVRALVEEVERRVKDHDGTRRWRSRACRDATLGAHGLRRLRGARLRRARPAATTTSSTCGPGRRGSPGRRPGPALAERAQPEQLKLTNP